MTVKSNWLSCSAHQRVQNIFRSLETILSCINFSGWLIFVWFRWITSSFEVKNEYLLFLCSLYQITLNWSNHLQYSQCIQAICMFLTKLSSIGHQFINLSVPLPIGWNLQFLNLTNFWWLNFHLTDFAVRAGENLLVSSVLRSGFKWALCCPLWLTNVCSGQS